MRAFLTLQSKYRYYYNTLRLSRSAVVLQVPVVYWLQLDFIYTYVLVSSRKNILRVSVCEATWSNLLTGYIGRYINSVYYYYYYHTQ